MAKICTHNTIFDFIKSGGTKGIGKMGGRGVTLSKNKADIPAIGAEQQILNVI